VASLSWLRKLGAFVNSHFSDAGGTLALRVIWGTNAGGEGFRMVWTLEGLRGPLPPRKPDSGNGSFYRAFLRSTDPPSRSQQEIAGYRNAVRIPGR
jgi:hypothetical protein